MRGEGNLQDHGQGSEEGVDDGAETGREGGREETSIDPRSEWVSGRERATARRWSCHRARRFIAPSFPIRVDQAVMPTPLGL